MKTRSSPTQAKTTDKIEELLRQATAINHQGIAALTREHKIQDLAIAAAFLLDSTSPEQICIEFLAMAHRYDKTADDEDSTSWVEFYVEAGKTYFAKGPERRN